MKKRNQRLKGSKESAIGWEINVASGAFLGGKRRTTQDDYDDDCCLLSLSVHQLFTMARAPLWPPSRN
jgi:hypothetical protein